MSALYTNHPVLSERPLGKTWVTTADLAALGLGVQI